MEGTWRGVLLFGGGPVHLAFTNDDDTWMYHWHINLWREINR